MTSFCILEVHFRAFLSVEKYETNSGNLEVSLVQSLPFLTFWIFIFELIPLWTISVPKYVLGFLMKVRQLFDIGQINQSIVVWCLLKNPSSDILADLLRRWWQMYLQIWSICYDETTVVAKKDEMTLIVKLLTKSFYPFWPPLYHTGQNEWLKFSTCKTE